ncbi:hypothetical protein AC579_172 [Pseudocercospora musae]|uniref:Uncharacterized protein n=1 Tax=Pseudocercospora musae TaxID=113226 RepID=A0A139IA26_9PEZI|nr:hypothetical protein AC579_172 [Pseudocercospora musae]
MATGEEGWRTVLEADAEASRIVADDVVEVHLDGGGFSVGGWTKTERVNIFWSFQDGMHLIDRGRELVIVDLNLFRGSNIVFSRPAQHFEPRKNFARSQRSDHIMTRRYGNVVTAGRACEFRGFEFSGVVQEVESIGMRLVAAWENGA